MLTWFDYEVRTRKLIYELMQPQIIHQSDDRDRLEKLTRLVQVQHQDRL
jgi:hypothetical protein